MNVTVTQVGESNSSFANYLTKVGVGGGGVGGWGLGGGDIWMKFGAQLRHVGVMNLILILSCCVYIQE